MSTRQTTLVEWSAGAFRPASTLEDPAIEVNKEDSET